MSKIYLLRHGKTVYNTENMVQGWCNSPLTQEGITATKELGEKISAIDFSQVYTSDSERSIETANLILDKNIFSKQATRTELFGLRELCFGKYETKSTDILWDSGVKELGIENITQAMTGSLKPFINFLADSDETRKFENYEKAKDRVMSAFCFIVDSADEDSNILIVSHGMTVCIILNELGYVPKSKIENLSLMEISFSSKNSYDVKMSNYN